MEADLEPIQVHRSVGQDFTGVLGEIHGVLFSGEKDIGTVHAGLCRQTLQLVAVVMMMILELPCEGGINPEPFKSLPKAEWVSESAKRSHGAFRRMTRLLNPVIDPVPWFHGGAEYGRLWVHGAQTVDDATVFAIGYRSNDDKGVGTAQSAQWFPEAS